MIPTREWSNDPLPEGWEHTGATHCTHRATQAAVWYRMGLGYWCYHQRYAPVPGPVNVDGTAATREEAMRLALQR